MSVPRMETRPAQVGRRQNDLPERASHSIVNRCSTAGTTQVFNSNGRRRLSPEERWYALFLAPTLILLLGITFGPFLYSLYLSLTSYSLTKPGGPKFIGLQNYLTLFQNGQFQSAVLITVLMLALSLTLQLTLGVTVALLLNREGRWVNLMRSLLLLPMMITPIVAALMWQLMLNNEYGVVRYLFGLVGIASPPVWLGDPRTALLTLVVIDSWQWTPMVILFVAAALKAVPNDYIEVARIEGASYLQIVWRILLPLLRPTLVVVALLRGIDVIKLFDPIYVLTQGGPGNATETVTFHAYRTGFAFFNMGYAATMAIIIMIAVTMISSRVLQLFRLQQKGQVR
jgi:multiple sugar transport system permease protein